MPTRFGVTTCYKPAPSHAERARSLSERLQVPFVERRAFDVMFERASVEVLYVVGRSHEELVSRDGATCFVQQGLLSTKLTEGDRHPFLRALGAPCDTVVDCTLGLANDALHAAVQKKCAVIGVEKSPVLAALLEDGLARLGATYPAAKQISLRPGDALDVLREMPARSADVVMLDPMMSQPKKSAPSFSLLRRFAAPDRATPALLVECARVARRRVVLKLGKGAPLPPDSPLSFPHHERGAHVVYWVHDVA